ncbi:Protein DDI1 like protein 1 [Nosema granulosis]|uniref:Protein DDI1 like protein 1 n=1 Tax=Nosema granulosis TaxID=83296 RepID=A0A9P6KXR7_9MICR|nr:Protein DDI1 like protein 1 [Nosema granulosis]
MTNKVFFEAQLNDVPTKLIVDTGSDYNFISKNTADKIRTAFRTSLNHVFITLADGSKHEVKEKLSVTLRDERNSDVREKEEFYIIQKLPYDGLIGQDFLQKHNCTISYENGKGTISMKKQEDTTPDETILNKIYSPYSWSKRVKEIITKYQLSNPKLGLIKGHKMQLHLSDDNPVR